MIAITIDDLPCLTPAGTTVLAAARTLGRHVPTLCHHRGLIPTGSCRLCLVEVVGGNPVAACHTPVREDTHYRTQSPLLDRLRRQTLTLILSEHPLNCPTCPSRGGCELQRLTTTLGVTTSPYPTSPDPPPLPDLRHPLITVDRALCIACGRCVQVAESVQGCGVWNLSGRGLNLRLIAGLDTDLESAGCVACGQCVTVCPTGALRDALSPLPGEGGVQRITTTCGYCAVGCQLLAEVHQGRLHRMIPDPDGAANRGHACLKGRYGHDFIDSPDRLRQPLIREPDGSFRSATPQEAIDRIARRLTELRKQPGPPGFAAISSARCTNEENYLIQKFTRMVMGSNSVDNCARVCHSPSAYALGEALGTGAATGSFEDVEQAELILLVGANPTEAHPVLGARIKQAVLAGCRLIVIDPRPTELASLADLHLPLRPGSNLALITALQQVVIADHLVNETFVRDHAENFEALCASLSTATPEWAGPLCGLDPASIRQAARWYAASPRAMILWGLGITESCHGSQAAFGLINLAVLTGQIGRPGASIGPIRGQNNVQGACDMGALPNVFSDYRPVVDPVARADHRRVWGVDPPTVPGWRIPDMWEAGEAGALQAMLIVAQDVVQSDPDRERVTAALERLDLLVVVDLFFNETAKYAHVILPAASFLEKEGTFVNSDRRIQRVRPVVEPPAGVRSDGDWLNAIARAMGVDLHADGGPGTPVDPGRVLAEVVRLTPNWGGVSLERLTREKFIQWPCPHPGHPGTPIVHRDGAFLRGRARLTPTPYRPPAESVDETFPLMLTTGRVLHHYNVGTMTRRSAIARLRAAREERVGLHPEDAARLGIGEGDPCWVISRWGRVLVRARVSREVVPGLLFLSFHFPATRTNLLVGGREDAVTRCPEYKVIAVRIEPASERPLPPP